ncbi:MAG: Ig-like domain-containing protein [Gaiellales bacterium]
MTTALRLALRLPLLLIPLVVLAVAEEAGAADATITYQRLHDDPSGIALQVGPGLQGCGAGCSTLRVPARTAIGARRQAILLFHAPVGTTIVDARLRLRYRTRQAGVVAGVQARIGGRWIDQSRLRSGVAVSRTLVTGRGATAVAVVLSTESAIAGTAVRTAHENMIAVDGVELRVRDTAPPTLSWLQDPADGGWQRGTLCAALAAADSGLGVDRLEYQIGAATAVVQAPGGSRLQPRPPAFDARPCIDTTSLPDGAYGTAASAVDSGDGGNRTTRPGALVRIDNVAPDVEFGGPLDPEARMPELTLAVRDAASGVERVEAQVDGFAVSGSLQKGVLRFQPPQALADGLHRVSWQVVDVAGNRSEGSEVIVVRDTTPPTIDEIAPQGPADATAEIAARIADAGAGIAPDGVRVAVDGVDMTAAADIADGVLRLRRASGWPAGEHVVRVVATDRSGNRVQREWAFSTSLPAPPAEVAPPPPAEAADEGAEAAPAPAGVRLAMQGRLRVRAASAPLAVRVVRDVSALDGVAVLLVDARGRRVADAVTNVDGVAVLRVPRSAAGRLVVRALDGEGVVVVTAVAPVLLRVDRRSAPAGSAVRLRGHAPARSTVVVEARAGSRWISVVRLRADGAGVFQTPVRLPTPGRYAVRVRSGDVASAVLRLTAR